MNIDLIPEEFLYIIKDNEILYLKNLSKMYNIKVNQLYTLIKSKHIPMDESVEEKENYTVKLQDLPEEFTFIVERFKDKGRSKGEDEMYRFVKSLGVTVIPNDRNAISPKEIDIYMPDNFVGIEYDGLHWHKESSLVEKTDLCDKKGIRLIRFYEDEWLDNPAICKSLIRSALNIYNEKIALSKCKVLEIADAQYKQFLKNNHIHGYAESQYKLGLFFEGRLVYAIGVKKYKKYYILNRICPKLNTFIDGALPKLLKEVHKRYKIDEIYTYADRRTLNVKFYKHCGFKLLRVMPCEYFYVVRGERLGKFDGDRIEKLLKKKYNPNLSDEQNLHNNGYDRIFDCGSYKMKINFS